MNDSLEFLVSYEVILVPMGEEIPTRPIKLQYLMFFLDVKSIYLAVLILMTENP